MRDTQAHAEFRQALAMAAELMRQEVAIVADPPPPEQQSIASGLRGGAAVLMVAAFEAYLDDLVTELAGYIADAKPPVVFAKLPEDMQVWNVFQTLKLAMDGPRYQQSGRRVERLRDIRSASFIIARDGINPDAFGGTSGNPGKDAVKALFKRLGVHDILALVHQPFEYAWAEPIAVDFIKDKLEEIVKRRHKVAHRADALSISRDDLATAERFLRTLGATLEAVATAYIGELCERCKDDPEAEGPPAE